jgi:imidazolonepropionase
MANSFTLTNISQLITNNSAIGDGDLGVITNAAITVTDGIVSWVGQASDADSSIPKTDAGGRTLIPGFVDSHSHLMFAGDRSEEFAARMAGVPYSAGGIKVTTAATRSASDEQLRIGAQKLIAEMHESGTTTIEIKSGYGLDVATEERCVRIATELTDEVMPYGKAHQRGLFFTTTTQMRIFQKYWKAVLSVCRHSQIAD